MRVAIHSEFLAKNLRVPRPDFSGTSGKRSTSHNFWESAPRLQALREIQRLFCNDEEMFSEVRLPRF
jgi:hypothetical protein